MHHITLSSLVVFSAICLLYALVALAILQFSKVAKLKPNPPTSSTVLVELTISTPAPADEFAKTVTDILTVYSSPSRSELLEFLRQTGGPFAGLVITHQGDSRVRNLTLLGQDAEKVSSYLTQCFNFQLTSGTDEFHYERVSLTA
jgi:hypothetical protein